MLRLAKYKGFGVLLVMAMVALLTGCKKALVEEPGDAAINFIIDWSGIKQGVTPPSDAVIYLYPESGGAPVASRASTVTKAEFKVKAGSYRIIMYNDGLQKIRVANSQSCNDFVGYLEPIPIPASVGTRSGEDVIVPESDYLHLLTGTSSKKIEVLADIKQDFTLRPRTATHTLRLKAEIKTTKEYQAVRARLSGIATRIELFTARVLGEGISSVDVPMSFMPTNGNKMAIGQTEIIGIDPVNRNPGSNMLELVLTPTKIGDQPLPDVVLKEDLTEKLSVYENMSIVVEILVRPDPYEPEKLEMEVTIKPWEVDPPFGFDVVPTE